MKGQAQHLGAAAPANRDLQPFSATAIEPARRQFIERLLAELGLNDDRSPRSELIGFVHRRLFLEKAPIEAIRVELRQQKRLARVVAIASGKGGVGKTTVSVNLAVAMANSGHRVLLFDADFGMANAHVFSGIAPQVTLLDVVDGRRRLEDAIAKGPAGIHVICGGSGIGRLADLGAPQREALGRDLMRVAEAYDLLLLDTGAGISPAVTHFLGMADDILVVTTPNIAATLDAYGLIKVAHESLFRARLNLLVNLAEDETQARVVHERISGCATRFLQRPVSFRGCLLRDAGVEQANQSRSPFVLLQPGHFNSQQFARIADHFRPAAVMAQTAAA